MGSPGRAKSRHNKREQRGPAEKLAGGDRGEGTRPGQAPAQVAGGAPAGPAAPRGARSRAAAPPGRPAARPGLPARSRRLVPPAAAPSFSAATGSPAQSVQKPLLSPPPAGPRRAPFPGSLSNFRGRGRWDGGVGSARPAGLHRVNRATDEALSGLQRCQSEVWGRGSRAGRRVGSDGAPHPSPGHTGSWRGPSGWSGQRGPRGTASGPEPPAPPPRRSSNFTKSEISRRPRGWRHPGGAGLAPGGPVRANFGRPVGAAGRAAGAASVALRLRRRPRLGFDVCESSGRLRRQAADSCVL